MPLENVATGDASLAFPVRFNKTDVRIGGPIDPLDANGPSAGAFFTQYTDESGDTYLQGGTVSGGTGNISVADILICDHVTGWIGTAGQHLVQAFSGTGVIEDGVILPGFNVSAAPTPYPGTPGSTTLPTASDAGGDGEISLGIFTAAGFNAANVGNIQISFCPGSFTITRS